MTQKRVAVKAVVAEMAEMAVPTFFFIPFQYITLLVLNSFSPLLHPDLPNVQRIHYKVLFRVAGVTEETPT